MKTQILTGLLSFAFAFTLHAVAPLIGDVPDQNIAQSTNTGTLYFTIGDTETTFTALTMSAVSSSPTLVPNNAANLQLGGTTSQRTIRVVPVAGQQGTAVITLTVTDGEALTASSTFSVTVTAANTKPTLTGLPGYQVVSPGQTPAALSFTVGDAETAAASLNIVATSSNTDLVPNANLALGGSGAARTVQVTPAIGQKGSAVIRLLITDALGASAQGEFIFSVFDAAAANNGFKQPRGIFLLDSVAGTSINGVPMRDANVRNLPFVDGYVLRTEWATLEPSNGVFDFTIIDNIFTKLPANQKLSLLIASGVMPTWLSSLPGIATWTAGAPSFTAPIPWDAIAQERYRLLLVALGDHIVDGVQFRNHPRFAAINAWIPGLFSGIRDPSQISIRNLPGYSRTNMQNGVLTHLANVTDNFPNVPVQIGFWAYVDNQDASFGGVAAWEQLRQLILAQQNGVTRPRVGFWMENLAANRPAANTDPWVGLPNLTFTAPLYNSQNSTFVGYQVLGSWSRPFASAHVDNLLNGSPEDGMDYGFNDFQCRYYEHYQADVDFANYTAEFQRWHDFLNELPAPPTSNPGTLALTSTSYSVAENVGSIAVTVTRSGGTTGAVSVAYATSSGTASAGSDYTTTTGTLNWADGDSASKSFTVPILNDLAHETDKTVTLTLSNATGSAALGTATATLTILDDDPAFTLAVSTGGTSITGMTGSAWNITLSASGGTGPYAWSVAGGTLPAGITLGSGGTLTGTPTTPGTYTIAAQATDVNGHTDTTTFTLTVSAPAFTVALTRNGDGTCTLAWPTTIGEWYQVEFSSDLVNWTLLGNSVSATTSAMTWTDSGTLTGTHPSTQTKRFYRVRNWGFFTVTYSGNAFTYRDTQRTVNGIFIKPSGPGPFPSLIINHGTGGSAAGFGLQRANEMSPWGLACIAANLTHMQGATQDLTTWGYSSENSARIRACQAILATRSDVNLNRLAMWGHSRGAFASIGIASDFGRDLKALGFSAGGILDDSDTSEPSYPSVTEASHSTAPTLMFLGSTDLIVPPANSLRLQTLLNTLGTTNNRIVYDTTGITPTSDAHNIQNTQFYTATTTGILDQWRAWLITHGILP